MGLGVGIIICKRHSLELIKKFPSRSYYLDLYKQFENIEKKSQTRFTPPVQTIYSLKQAIQELHDEGLYSRVNRYRTNYKRLKEGMVDLGFKIYDLGAAESGILFTVYEPEAYNFNKIHDILYSKGYTIYQGKISLKNTFRVSVIGDLKLNDINSFLGVLGSILRENN